MKAIIEIDVPDYQIGQEVSIYFKDTMMIKGVVQEPKTGYWINSKHTSSVYCSECNCTLYEEEVNGELNYCPECGARMESEDKE